MEIDVGVLENKTEAASWIASKCYLEAYDKNCNAVKIKIIINRHISK